MLYFAVSPFATCNRFYQITLQIHIFVNTSLCVMWPTSFACFFCRSTTLLYLDGYSTDNNGFFVVGSSFLNPTPQYRLTTQMTLFPGTTGAVAIYTVCTDIWGVSTEKRFILSGIETLHLTYDSVSILGCSSSFNIRMITIKHK